MEESLLFLEIMQFAVSYFRDQLNNSWNFESLRQTIHFDKFVFINELETAKTVMDSDDEYLILISGDAGSGKTSFLYRLCSELNLDIKNGVIRGGAFFDVHNLSSTSDVLTINYFEQHNKNIPVLIDDIELINNPNDCIKQLRKIGIKKIVVTSRNRDVLMDFGCNHTIILKPLSYDQFQNVFNENIKKYYNIPKPMDASMLDELTHRIYKQASSLTPRDVRTKLISYVQSFNNTGQLIKLFLENRHLLYQYGKGVDLSSEIILPQKQIITPSINIITEVRVLDNSLLQRVKSDPAIIERLSPREFEKLVCDLLDAQGYIVELTPQTRDGGKDIIVTKQSELGDFCIYVECKKYDKSNPVRVKLVRELYGTVMADNVTAGLMVTTSYYTKDAYEFRETVRNRIQLKDYQGLVYDISRLK